MNKADLSLIFVFKLTEQKLLKIQKYPLYDGICPYIGPNCRFTFDSDDAVSPSSK